MAGTFKQFCKLLTLAVSILLGVLTAAIVVIALMAVWWRYAANDPIGWTEQVSRILFVWMTFLGAAVLYRQRMHIAIDMFVNLLPGPSQKFLYWAVEFAVLVFVLVFFTFGLKLSLDTWDNTYGALDITPATFYLAAPVSSALIIIYFLERLIDPELRRPAQTVLMD